jgi:hypothetical protein
MRLSSAETGTVILPFPDSDWCTRKKLSVIGSPPGPVGTGGAPF